MNYNKSFFGLFLAALVLLPGCMHVPTYKRRSLQSVSSHSVHRDTENNVIVQAKLLSQEDKTVLFGDRGASLNNNDIQVIHLSVDNESDAKYMLSPADIDFSVMSCRDVKKLMKTSSADAIVGVGISAGAIGASVWTVGMIGKTAASASAIIPVIFWSAVGVYCVGIGMGLVFIGKSIKSIIMNTLISKDLKEKMLHKKVTINPGDYYEGLIFVKSADYTPQFSVTMHEKGNTKNTVTFDVDLRDNASCA
jgi:hypothetical protein